MSIWFKRKTYGFGWTPVTWQGWVVIFIYVVFLFLILSMVDNYTDALTWKKLVSIVLLSAGLIVICYKKGEKPKWQWGKK